MKLLVLTPYFTANPEMGGPVVALANLLNELSESAEIKVITQSWKSTSYDPERDESNSTFKCISYTDPLTSFFARNNIFFSFPLIFRSLIELVKADLIIFNDMFVFSHIPVAAIASLLKKPFLLIPHGSYSLAKSRGRNSIKRLFFIIGGKLIVKNARAIICGSRQERIEARKTSFILNISDKTIVIPNVVKVASFSPHTPYTKRSQVVFIGRLQRVKGVSDLVDGFISYVARNPSCKLQLNLIGPDEGEATTIKQKIIKNSMRKRIIVSGFRNRLDALRILAKAKCLVLPSFSEGTPNVVIEAAALGIPVLVTKETNMAAVVKSGGGILITHKHESIINALQTVDMMSEARWKKISIAARQWNEKNHSVEIIIQNYINLIYQSVRMVRNREDISN